MFVQNTENKNNHFYIGFGKRILDLCISIFILLVLSPLFIVIALLIKLSSGGPVIFTQFRVGKNGKAFKIYKFRTMNKELKPVDRSVTSLNDSRITAIGKTLRKYKLDELPQFINVLKGDMSLVGPRPEVQKYVNVFKDEYSDILKVSPGLTDYAALRYKNEEEILASYNDVEEAYINIILPDKISLYNKYIKEMSFQTDLKIIFKTVLEAMRT